MYVYMYDTFRNVLKSWSQLKESSLQVSIQKKWRKKF